jgi:predicted transcriptional regulator
LARSSETKSILLRLDAELADQLEAVAGVEGRSVSAIAREAIAAHVEQRRRDGDFRKLVRDSIKRHQRLLRELDGDDS